jgi:hypothetical protein
MKLHSHINSMGRYLQHATQTKTARDIPATRQLQENVTADIIQAEQPTASHTLAMRPDNTS